MSIIFPNESKMSTDDLIMFKKELTELLYKESYSIKEFNNIKEILQRLVGYLLMADKKKLFNYFDIFYELNILSIINGLLDKAITKISFYILDCIYTLMTNIQNNGFIFYIYSTKYPTYIQGEYLNIIDKIISIDAGKKEEFLTYQVNFIKSLTLKLNIECIDFFFDKYKNQFPILNKAFALYNNKDAMIRSVVKNIFLTILKIKDKYLRRFITAFPNNIYYPNIIFQLRNIIIKLCLVNFFEENSNKNPIDKFRDEHDELIDHIYYIADMLLIGIDNVNFILINCILNEIILPLFKTIISKKEEKVSIVFALYIIILFVYIVKNKFINDVISYLLFEENISKILLDKIQEYEFKSINLNLMSNVNSLIIHNQYSDVNDTEWKMISKYMADVTGTDLSTGFVVKDNAYEQIKNIIYKKNNEKVTLIQNEIFSNIEMLLTAKDDSILLILNLLINSEISFYLNNTQSKIKNLDNNNKDNNNNNSNNNISNNNNNDNIKNINNDNNNDILNINEIINDNNNKNNQSNQNKKINVIDDEIIEKIKNDLFDDEYGEDIVNDSNNNIGNTIDDINAMNNEYNLFEKKFFKINFADSKNLFNLLLKLIENPKNFRSITNEIILGNILLLINMNNNEEEEKKKITQRIIEVFKGEIKKIKKILEEDQNLKKLAFPYSYKAFEQYINPIDKKVKDCITSPFILIPLIYLDNEKDTPKYLKENKFNYEILKVYILNIFILYDILNDLLGCQNSMIINTKKYPLETPKSAFDIGKECSDKDIGEERFLFDIMYNNKIINSLIFFDYEYIYIGQIMSNTYEDLSKIKIIKKIALRDVSVKIPKTNNLDEEENPLLEIYDNSIELNYMRNKNCIIINCVKSKNASKMNNFLKEQKNNALTLEYSLFESYIEGIERKISFC